MLKQHVFTIYIFLKSIILPCACDENKNTFQYKKGNQSVQIKRTGRLSSEINESSALLVADSSSFWTLNDSDGQPSLYRINKKGKLLDSIQIPNTENIDWEALATDTNGNIYIGDFGNNSCRRNDLKIYKFNPESRLTECIHFSYNLDTDSLNTTQPKNMDAEAMIWYNNRLYIFTKHWKNKMVKLYSLPDIAGTYQAQFEDSLYISSPVTDAAISPDQSQLALLTYGKIFLFDTENGINFTKPLRCIRFARSGQAEGITTLSGCGWLVSNENRKFFQVKIGR